MNPLTAFLSSLGLSKECTFGQTQLTLLSLARMRGRERLKSYFANIITEDATIPQNETLVQYASLLKDAILGGLYCTDAVWF